MTLITNCMKAFFGKLLFVLTIVGIIAAGNLLFPNPANDVKTATGDTETSVEQSTEQSADEPLE